MLRRKVYAFAIGLVSLVGAAHAHAQRLDAIPGETFRLRFDGEPGLALHRESGANVHGRAHIFDLTLGNPDSVMEYESVCIAPCVAEGTSGNFQFALSRSREPAIAVDGRTSFAPGNYVMHGEIESRALLRVLGWLSFIVGPGIGAAIGLPMMLYWEETRLVRTYPLTNAGLAAMITFSVVGLVAGTILVLLRDVAHITVEPDGSVAF